MSTAKNQPSGIRAALSIRREARHRTESQKAAADIMRRWATAVLATAGFGQARVARDTEALFRAGLSPAVAERVIQKALSDAQTAYKASLLQHSTEAATDSENTDTGRLARLP